MPLEEEVKIVNMPDNGRFPVVQLLIDKTPYMFCGYVHHSEILRDALKTFGITPEMIEVEEDLEKRDIPNPRGERYELVGAGFSSVDRERRIFVLPYGESKSYKNGTNHDFREKLRQQLSAWNVRSAGYSQTS